MLHRGPDEQKGYVYENVDLYHLRLSILDAVGGKQPMHLHDRYTFIFNGKIYNHAALIRQFGFTGTSYSDTETILLFFHQFREKCLDFFDGMFAFAIHDKIENTIFLARDRAGKKPLYIYNDGQKIVFASELNCLKALLPLEIDERNLLQYMRLGVFYKSLTPYKKVKELEPGSYAILDCNNISVTKTKWWNVHDFYFQQKKQSIETWIL